MHSNKLKQHQFIKFKDVIKILSVNKENTCVKIEIGSQPPTDWKVVGICVSS